jgi:hypothetical protein
MSIKMKKIDSDFSVPHNSRLLEAATLVDERPLHDSSTLSPLVETHRSLALGTVSTYASQIRASMGRSVFAVLDTAALVAEAKDALGDAGFRELAKILEQSPSTLNKYARIHSHRDRFAGLEEMLPCRWTVLYGLSRLPDQQFEALAASGQLRPGLSDREIKKFVAQQVATDDAMSSAPDEQDYLAAKIVFPAFLSTQREEDLKRKMIAAVEDEAGVTVKFSARQKSGRR